MKRYVVFGACALVIAGGIGFVAVLANRGGWRSPAWLASILGEGRARSVDAGLFCREHGVPEKFCTLCHEELKGALRACAEHGLPEEICTICHPEAAALFGLKPLCREHGLPEQFCTFCNASLLGGVVESGFCPEHWIPASVCLRCRPELAGTVAVCAEHELPAVLCVACNPELARNFTVCERHRLPTLYCEDPECADGPRPAAASAEEALGASLPLVRLARPEVERDAGITVAPVRSRSIAPIVEASGEVAYDDTRFARVRALVPGLVREVRVVEGMTVRRGDVLAIVDSATLGEAKANYLAASPAVDLWDQSLARLRGLSRDQLVPAKEVAQAEAELARAKADLLHARQRLRSLGLEANDFSKLDDEPEEARNRFEIGAPIDGTIVGRRIAPGEVVDHLAELFTVADLSRVWVNLAIKEADLAPIHANQPVEFVVDSLAPIRFEGTVSWIDPEIDHRTRSARVRATVENRHGSLRVNMFGSARIRVGEPRNSLAVPKDAVQWEGRSFIVFRRAEEGLFEPHRVLVGETRNGMAELIWSDLTEGDSVVCSGSFLLKTEIQKGSIGAGCCGE